MRLGLGLFRARVAFRAHHGPVYIRAHLRLDLVLEVIGVENEILGLSFVRSGVRAGTKLHYITRASARVRIEIRLR